MIKQQNIELVKIILEMLIMWSTEREKENGKKENRRQGKSRRLLPRKSTKNEKMLKSIKCIEM